MPSWREQGKLYLLFYAERLVARMAQPLYALNYRLDDPGNWGFDFRQAQDISPSKASRSALETTHLSLQRVAKSVAVAKAAGA